MLDPIPVAKRAWFLEPWPWALFGIPALTIVAGVITVFLALRSEDGLVADDYYKRGLAINQTLARDEIARQKGMHASVALKDGRLNLWVSGNPGVQLPGALRMHWAHPTHSGSDRIFTLDRRDGLYAMVMPVMLAGRWNVSIEDLNGEWRVVGGISMPFSGQVEIRP